MTHLSYRHLLLLLLLLLLLQLDFSWSERQRLFLLLAKPLFREALPVWTRSLRRLKEEDGVSWNSVIAVIINLNKVKQPVTHQSKYMTAGMNVPVEYLMRDSYVRELWMHSVVSKHSPKMWFSMEFGSRTILSKWINKDFRWLPVVRRTELLFAEGQGL